MSWIAESLIYGYSMGARTALAFAGNYPDRTLGVIVDDMHAKRLSGGKQYGDVKGWAQLIATLPENVERTPEQSTRDIP